MELDPRLTFRPQSAGRERLQDPGKPNPRRDARRRRRLRHEAFSLPRARPGVVGGEEARPCRQMDPRALRCLHDRHAGPRQHHPARAGARRRAALSGARCRDSGQFGRLSLELRPGDPDRLGRCHAQRGLCDPGDPCRGQGGIHQHCAGRRLSGRRAAGGGLCDRTADRLRRTQAQGPTAGIAAAKFHRARGNAVSDTVGAQL